MGNVLMASEAEIAWAAGLFEGEGCALVRSDKRRRADERTQSLAGEEEEIIAHSNRSLYEERWGPS